ncbi:hypothetical protein [Enorma sp.]|uniref:hypothetical protein n=1 Tax=Enorma sp. TaxID=1920692 RepID=UPI0025BF45BC|nr:hypothetical protein [Enorma sp.]
MKKKELLELMGDTAGILAGASSASEMVIDGDSYEVHQIAHGAAAALGMAIAFAKNGETIEPSKLAAVILKAAVDWEREHPDLMSKGGEDK